MPLAQSRVCMETQIFLPQQKKGKDIKQYGLRNKHAENEAKVDTSIVHKSINLKPWLAKPPTILSDYSNT